MSTPGVAPVRSLVRIPVSTPVDAPVCLVYACEYSCEYSCDSLSDDRCMGSKRFDSGVVGICMGFKGYHLKTHANSSIRICELLKPMQIALRYSESMASPFWSMSVSSERHGF